MILLLFVGKNTFIFQLEHDVMEIGVDLDIFILDFWLVWNSVKYLYIITFLFLVSLTLIFQSIYFFYNTVDLLVSDIQHSTVHISQFQWLKL